MKPEDREWLKKAVSSDEHRPELMRIHGNAASNGYVLLVAGNKLHKCQCAETKTHDNFQRLFDMKFGRQVAVINKGFLIDALSGFEDGQPVYLFCDDGKMLGITNLDNSKQAAVMCMDETRLQTVMDVRDKAWLAFAAENNV